ncbi:transcriptional regulator [Actinomadura sp. J1-007]|nr:transcriptional regulator [Actinomadura sp. J1-007]
MGEGRDGGRRGRRSRRPDPGEGPAAALAERLWRLKKEAGDPSYAEMSSALGAAASKSSLAAAARGRGLPTWGTTWEFVRVLAVDRLGADPERTEREWRAYWEEARDALTAAEDAAALPTGTDPEPTSATPSPPADPPRANESVDGDTQPVGVRPRRRPYLYVVAAAVVAALVAGVVVLVNAGHGSSAGKDGKGGKDGEGTRANAGRRDDSRFEGDVTYPDGTKVRGGTTFRKVWRIRNTGDLHWKRRYLLRVGSGPCSAPKSVAMPDAAPGQAVDVGVRVTAPRTPGRCRIYWKMADEHGRVLMPDKRPVFLDVAVVRP